MFKYVIGKGNNSIMVRNLFKNRFWWVPYEKEEMEKCNFIWTQIRKNNLMEVLPCLYPQNKAGIKNCKLGAPPVPTNASANLMATPQQKSSKKKKSVQPGSEKANTSKIMTEKNKEYKDQQDIL